MNREELMTKYKDTFELIVRCFNKYSNQYSKPRNYGGEIEVSFAEIQVIEKVLNADRINITGLSKKLGITKGAVTRSINRLRDKGLIEKYKAPDNRKKVFVRVTSLGEKIHTNYEDFIYQALFKDLLQFCEAKSDFSDNLDIVFKKLDDFLDQMNDKN